MRRFPQPWTHAESHRETRKLQAPAGTERGAAAVLSSSPQRLAPPAARLSVCLLQNLRPGHREGCHGWARSGRRTGQPARPWASERPPGLIS